MITPQDIQRALLLRRYSGYRTADLILHLDAINNTGYGHSSNATTWKNLAGNFDVTLYNASWGSDYCAFTGADDSYGLGAKWTFTKGCTIEVIYSNEGDAVKGGIVGWSYAQQSYYLKPSAFLNDAVSRVTICMNSQCNLEWISSKGIRTYIGFNKNTVRHNALTASLSLTPIALNVKTPNNFRLAAYGTTSNTNWVGGCLNGRICAVRVYNADLTADEIEAHYQIDKARFNIP